MSECTTFSEWNALLSSISAEQPVFHIGPEPASGTIDWSAAVEACLRSPIGARPVSQMAESASDAVILVDDATRPTPQRKLLPPLLDTLERSGLPAANITVLIALGTHRYMTRSQIRERFGTSVARRVNVFNHTWRDPSCFTPLGSTASGVPLSVNRLAVEADLIIGTGSIVPHIWAGWGGGAKIVLPGISAADSIAPTHALAEHEDDLRRVSGRAENACRQEIERAARRAGLDLILNCVVDADGRPIWIGAGDPVEAHRAGVAIARQVFVRDVPRRADIVLADARPATKDYWQGIKALAHAARGVREGGAVVLAGTFPEGVAPTHPQFREHANRSVGEIRRAAETGEITDPVVVTTLCLHAMLRRQCRVICLSPGLSEGEASDLGFWHARNAGDALHMARELTSPSGSVGLIDYAGDVLPAMTD